ncbi:MAG: DNA modification methylase [Bryobacteraceae bacterium]|jgi:DNA modification methylase
MKTPEITSVPEIVPQAIAGVPRMAIVYKPISWFREYSRNPRKNDAAVDRMCNSIREFGFAVPMLCRSTGEIIDGHLRFKGARKLDLQELPTILCDHWTESQVKAFRLVVNRSVTWAEFDEEKLALELQELRDSDFDLNLTGFDGDELARLLAGQDATEGLTDEDAVPVLPQAAVSSPGDLFALGDHKLLVGDATITADVERLMAGDTADLVFSDLPYNSAYEGYTKEKLAIQNDDMSPEQFGRFLRGSLANFRTVVKPGASLYICHSSSFQREFQNALEAAGFQIRCQIIWAKNTFAWGFGRYKFQHEPIFYCHVASQKDPWYRDKTQSTLWQENKPAANRLHPTMKPVELIERALLNSSKTGDIVVDLFGGSGSTLIGCERRGRKARLMEIDPRYADVICRRYQDYTGKPAVLDGDGRTFEEIAQIRKKESA